MKHILDICRSLFDEVQNFVELCREQVQRGQYTTIGTEIVSKQKREQNATTKHMRDDTHCFMTSW